MQVKIGKYPKNNKARKVNVRIDPHDLWSLDNTLAHIIHPALIQLKVDKQGCPWVDPKDAPHIERLPCADGQCNQAGIPFNQEAWEYVLDEMIWTMQQIKDDLPDELLEFKNVDYKALEAYHNRIRKGCELFGAYFRHLWT